MGAERTDCSTVSPYNQENDTDLLFVPVCCLRGELYVFGLNVFVVTIIIRVLTDAIFMSY
jgi:hypothetical protein